MRITVSGGSGFIGERLRKRLLGAGHSLFMLGRRPRAVPGVRTGAWDAMAGEPPREALDDADAIIHLAGEPVAQRWTPEVKRRIRASRVEGTRHLVDAIGRLPRRPGVMVCASAVGYYGSRGEERLTERSAPGSGFLPEVCVAWENEEDRAAALGVRVVKLRIGVVLGAEGGALKQMLPPFRMGVGGRLGGGGMWMSWIHAEDLVSLIVHALHTPALSGAVNAVAPNPVRNAEFTRALAAAVKRPALLPFPEFALRLVFGEMAGIVLASQHITPAAALEAGFRFEHPEIGPALRDLLG